MSNLAALQRKARERREAAKREWVKTLDRNGTAEPLSLLAKTLFGALRLVAERLGYEDARYSHQVRSYRDLQSLTDCVTWKCRVDGWDDVFESYYAVTQFIWRAYRDSYDETFAESEEMS